MKQRLLRPEQAAKLLGMSRTSFLRDLDKLVSGGMPPAIQVMIGLHGKRRTLRFDEVALNAWLDQQIPAHLRRPEPTADAQGIDWETVARSRLTKIAGQA